MQISRFIWQKRSDFDEKLRGLFGFFPKIILLSKEIAINMKLLQH